MKNHTPRNPIFIAAIYGAAIILLVYLNGLEILPDPYFYLTAILPIVWAAFVKPYRLSWELILILLAGAAASLFRENSPSETPFLILLLILTLTSSSVAIIQRALSRHWAKEELLHKERNLAVELSATHNLNFALRRCIEVSLDVTRLETVGICLVNPKNNLFELSNRIGANELATKLFQRLVQTPQISKKMMLGQPVYESLGGQQDKNKKDRQWAFFKAMGFIPIRHNDRTIGVFVVGSTRLLTIFPQTRSAIESIAAQVGSSIMHIQGEVKLQESQKALQVTRSRLEEAEARYRQMVEQVQAVIYLDAIDQERLAIYISPQVEVLLGYEQSEWMAHPNLWQQLIHPDDKERVMAEHHRTNATGEPFRCEYRFYRRDGRILWVHDEASLVRHEKDNPAYWQGLMYDITERKNAEEILACGMEMFQSLMDNIPDTIFFKDTNSRFTQANQATARFMGVPSSGALIGRTEADFLDESLAKASYQKEQAIIRTGRSLVNQVEFQPTRDGQKRWLSVTKVPMYDVNGNIVGIAGLSRDVTDTVRTQEALEKRLLALTRPLDDAASLNFEDLFNVKDIQAVQDAFAAATGVASVILDVRGYPITRPSNYCDLCNLIRGTSQGMKDCFRTDLEFGKTPANGLLIQKCILNGLLMSSASITVGDRHIANWMVGQIREDNGFAENYRHYAQSIGVDEEVYLKALDKVPRMSRQQFELIAQAHYLIAGQLSRLAIQNIQQAQEIVERKRLEYELRFVNTHDALTGLYNRTFFEAEMSRLQPSRQYPVSIIMIDVDGLKKTNDHLGHSAGDELLKEAAQIMRSAFRAEDVVARIGGDEFAVILPGTNAQIAQEVVSRLRSYLDTYNHQPHGLTVRLSIGVATGEKGGTLDAILHQADALMYADKRRGRMNQP